MTVAPPPVSLTEQVRATFQNKTPSSCSHVTDTARFTPASSTATTTAGTDTAARAPGADAHSSTAASARTSIKSKDLSFRSTAPVRVQSFSFFEFFEHESSPNGYDEEQRLKDRNFFFPGIDAIN
jgi:hypothetical protein